MRLRATLRLRGGNAQAELQVQQTIALCEQIQNLLTKYLTRVMDLFKKWDEDQSGTIDRREFVMAVRSLGVRTRPLVVRALFIGLFATAAAYVNLLLVRRCSAQAVACAVALL